MLDDLLMSKVPFSFSTKQTDLELELTFVSILLYGRESNEKADGQSHDGR